MNANSIFEGAITMLILYNTGILLLRFAYAMAAWFNPKAKAFRQGRREQVDILQKTFPLQQPSTLVWFHCASLGEFEQGRPVMEAMKAWRPEIKILLTFFSPSGFAVRKNYEHADFVFYLPWDTPKHATWFAENIRPAMAVFVKYEFWYHYTSALNKRKVPLLSISSIFRPEQIFFQATGSLFRTMLGSFSHFFVQNKESVDLLQSLGITEVTLAGDTRFDRVNQGIQKATEIPLVTQFKDGQKLMVIGSAWPEDMEILYPFINENQNRIKFIIAPHEIQEGFIQAIEKSVEGKAIRYSNADVTSVQGASIMIIDNVGMLSRLYQYGEFAFIGGAFGQGLHNILEAACYGIPIFFGNKAFQKYQEAVDLVMRGGAFEVGNFIDLKSKYELMTNSPETFLLACEVTRQYVSENLGATEKIMAYSKKILA